MGKMQVILVFLVLALCGNCFTEDETELSNQVEEDVSCSQYCDGTYPEHTYPDVSTLTVLVVYFTRVLSSSLQPEDHSACSRGCRLAVMDALIAWPFSPTSSSCLASKTLQVFLAPHLMCVRVFFCTQHVRRHIMIVIISVMLVRLVVMQPQQTKGYQTETTYTKP